MAFTIEKQPQRITPAYNQLIYEVDSTDKNKTEFRYFADVMDSSNNLLFRKKVSKRITDGFGVFDLQRELSNLVSFDYKLEEDANYDANKSYFNLKIQFGEMYYESWEWNDFIFCGANDPWWTNGGNPQFNPNGKDRVGIAKTTSGGQPPYQIGDFIDVNLNAGTQDAPYLQGTHKVLDVVYINQTLSGQYYGWVVILEELWGGSGSTTGGTSNYSDGRKTEFERGTIQELMVFNAAFKFTDFVDYDVNQWEILNASSNILSVELNNIREDNFYLANILIGASKSYRINFKNDSGDESYISKSTTSHEINQINIGTNRTSYGTLVAGSFPIIKPNTKWYEVTITDWLDAPISKTYRIYIDRSCLVERIDCLFLDHLGSFAPYTFGLKKEESNNVDRNTYERILPTGYKKDSNGIAVFNSEYSRSLILRTDYLKESESELLPHLLRSPVVLIKYEGEWIKVNITTSSFTVKKDKWHELKRYDVNVEFANKGKINI